MALATSADNFHVLKCKVSSYASLSRGWGRQHGRSPRARGAEGKVPCARLGMGQTRSIPWPVWLCGQGDGPAGLGGRAMGLMSCGAEDEGGCE